MSKRKQKWIKQIVKNGAFMVVLFLILAGNAYAQNVLGSDWAQFLGGLPNFSGTEGETGEDLAIAFIRNAIRIVKFIIGGIAAIFGVIYAMNLIFSGSKEETITKQKKNFIGLFIGFIILMIADEIAGVFNPELSTNQTLIDFDAANDQLRDITNYIKWLFGSVIVLFMTITGIRVITGGQEEEVVTKAKRQLLWSGIGMLVMLLASNIVNAIYVTNEATRESAPGAPEGIVAEIASIIRLVLVFLGPVAVLFTIYAGFMMLTAMDQEEKVTKAKKMLSAGIMGIVIVYSAYAIVNTIIQAQFIPEIA